MPEPNRAPAAIEANLDTMPFWRLIEQRAVLRLECEACHHVAVWTVEAMHRLFHTHRSLTVAQVAPKLRCTVCRSEWVWIARDYTSRRGRPISESQGGSRA